MLAVFVYLVVCYLMVLLSFTLWWWYVIGFGNREYQLGRRGSAFWVKVEVES